MGPRLPARHRSTVGAHDAWGPGTRIPALVLSRAFKHSGVDHTVYDTTSIMATIERSFGLDPVATRDAVVNDLAHAVRWEVATAVRAGDPQIAPP